MWSEVFGFGRTYLLFRGEKKFMVSSCCVVKCVSRGPNFKMFRLPTGKKKGGFRGGTLDARKEEQRRKWLAAINRKSLPKQVYVCQKHFITSQPSDDDLHPDFVPSLYLGYTRARPVKSPIKSPSKARLERRQRLRVRQVFNDHGVSQTKLADGTGLVLLPDQIKSEPVDIDEAQLSAESEILEVCYQFGSTSVKFEEIQEPQSESPPLPATHESRKKAKNYRNKCCQTDDPITRNESFQTMPQPEIRDMFDCIIEAVREDCVKLPSTRWSWTMFGKSTFMFLCWDKELRLVKKAVLSRTLELRLHCRYRSSGDFILMKRSREQLSRLVDLEEALAILDLFEFCPGYGSGKRAVSCLGYTVQNFSLCNPCEEALATLGPGPQPDVTAPVHLSGGIFYNEIAKLLKRTNESSPTPTDDPEKPPVQMKPTVLATGTRRLSKAVGNGLPKMSPKAPDTITISIPPSVRSVDQSDSSSGKYKQQFVAVGTLHELSHVTHPTAGRCEELGGEDPLRDPLCEADHNSHHNPDVIHQQKRRKLAIPSNQIRADKPDLSKELDWDSPGSRTLVNEIRDLNPERYHLDRRKHFTKNSTLDDPDRDPDLVAYEDLHCKSKPKTELCVEQTKLD